MDTSAARKPGYVPIAVLLAMEENDLRGDSNFPVDFVRRPGQPEDWTYTKARPQVLGEKDDDVCHVWYQGYGCRDWLLCDHGTHPRFVWKKEYNDSAHGGHGNTVQIPAGYHDLLDGNFCRKNLRHPSAKFCRWDQCCRDDIDDRNSKSGCHRLHQCTPYSKGSFLHENGRWYMPYSWMSSLDEDYRKAAHNEAEKYAWEPQPDNQVQKCPLLDPSVEKPGSMTSENFDRRCQILEDIKNDTGTKTNEDRGSASDRPTARNRERSRNRRVVRLDAEGPDAARVRRAATPAPKKVSFLDEGNSEPKYTTRQLENTMYGIPGLGLEAPTMAIIEDINLDLNRINLAERYENPGMWAIDKKMAAARQLDQFVRFFNQELIEEGNIKNAFLIVRKYLHVIRERHGMGEYTIPDRNATCTE